METSDPVTTLIYLEVHGPDYRGVSAVDAAVLFAKSQTSLVVLGLPSTVTFQVLFRV
jgi:hypothetical protein